MTAVTPRALSRNQPSARSAPPDLPEAAQRIVELTNAIRRRQGLADVAPNPRLAKAARYFSDFMSRTDKFSHAADGTEPAQRAKKFGYEYCAIAENIAYEFNSAGFTTHELARRFFEGWQNSPGHRKNMVDPNVTETAVVISPGSTGRYYAVQLFGRPLSQSIEFSIANRAGTAVNYQIDDQTLALPSLATRTHQLCRRPQLRFRGETLQPQHGQRLVVVNEQGSVRLQVQQPPRDPGTRPVAAK